MTVNEISAASNEELLSVLNTADSILSENAKKEISELPEKAKKVIAGYVNYMGMTNLLLSIIAFFLFLILCFMPQSK